MVHLIKLVFKLKIYSKHRANASLIPMRDFWTNHSFILSVDFSESEATNVILNHLFTILYYTQKVYKLKMLVGAMAFTMEHNLLESYFELCQIIYFYCAILDFIYSKTVKHSLNKCKCHNNLKSIKIFRSMLTKCLINNTFKKS